MVPASNMKIIVSAAALRYLGPHYEYKTRVGLCGNTLVVIGSGDPLLGDKATDTKYSREAGWIFEDIAAALKRNGVTTIKDIIVDSSIFDDQRVHPNWPKEELNRWYACEVSGLNFNGNCIDIKLRPASKPGSVALFTLLPHTKYVNITNQCTTIGTGKNTPWAARKLNTNDITLRGSLRREAGAEDRRGDE